MRATLAPWHSFSVPLPLITEDAISETSEYLEHGASATEIVETFAEEQPNVAVYVLDLFKDVEDAEEREEATASALAIMSMFYEFMTTQELIDEEEYEQEVQDLISEFNSQPRPEPPSFPTRVATAAVSIFQNSFSLLRWVVRG